MDRWPGPVHPLPLRLLPPLAHFFPTHCPYPSCLWVTLGRGQTQGPRWASEGPRTKTRYLSQIQQGFLLLPSRPRLGSLGTGWWAALCASFWMLVSFLLRFLDDRVDGVITAAVRALRPCWWPLEMRYNMPRHEASWSLLPCWACPHRQPVSWTRSLLPLPPPLSSLRSSSLAPSWYHGALIFALMPSQGGQGGRGRGRRTPAEKAKTKSSEEGNRLHLTWPDMTSSRYKRVVQLYQSRDLQGKHVGQEGSSRPGAQLHLLTGLCLNLRASGYQPAASAALHTGGDLPRTFLWSLDILTGAHLRPGIPWSQATRVRDRRQGLGKEPAGPGPCPSAAHIPFFPGATGAGVPSAGRDCGPRISAHQLVLSGRGLPPVYTRCPVLLP